MVVGAFPLAKLGVLLVRQISKPIAGYLKQRAKNSHTFRNYICLPTAQFYHWAETRYKLWIMGFGKPAQVTPLNEQLAVELGADILAEVFLFSIAAGGLTAEYIRSSASSRKKEEAQELRLRSMEAKLVELDLQLEQHRAQLREFERNSFSSPLRALKEAFSPSSSGTSKGDQKPGAGATIPTPPGPDATPVAPTSSSQSTSDKTRGDKENVVLISPKDEQSTSATGTVSAVYNTGLDPNAASGSTDIRSSASIRKPEDAYTAKLIRRALKILIDAYEEIEDD